MTKESKQGLNLAVKVIAITWALLYVIVVITYLKLDISNVEVVKQEGGRFLFALGSAAIFIITWQSTRANLRMANSQRDRIQSGGKMSEETLTRMKQDNDGMEAWVWRTADGKDYTISFRNPD